MSSGQKVLYRFTVKTKKGELKKLRIQEMPTDLKEEVVDLFARHFAPEETFHKIAGVTNNEEALAEYKNLNEYLMKESSVAICCADDDSYPQAIKVIGAGIMTLKNIHVPRKKFDFKMNTKELQRFIQIMMPMLRLYDAMKQFNLDTFYDDFGVVVHSDYRGLGIAEKLFHARRLVCKDEGIQMTGAWMTGIGSQKAAERDGWETVFEISNEEYGKLVDITFDAAPPTFKYMIAKPL